MSLVDLEDTIVAIASPTSPAPRGVVRLSGEGVASVLRKMGVQPGEGARPNRMEVSIDLGEPLGCLSASLLWWPTSRSYTGQPSAELHSYGSLPILTAMVAAAIDAGARAARPGEFTMRSFLAGRLDLTQAEAVLGVIEAEQRGTLDHALRQLAGNLSRPLEQIRSDLMNLLADVEAGLDFVDEDIEFISDEALIDRLTNIDQLLSETWRMMEQRGGVAARPVIALRGEPNAGKSCLLNRLADQEAAIVADVPGTTRDAVTSNAVIAQRHVKLVDTAGIDSVRSEIEQRSQDQAVRASADACLRLWCVDGSRSDFEQASASLKRMAGLEQTDRVLDLWVMTKSDQVDRPDMNVGARAGAGPEADVEWIVCSAVTGQGMEDLQGAILRALSSRDAEETGSVVGTAARCRDSLQRARVAVTAAIDLTRNQQGHEFVATELRTVANALGEVTGAVYTDDILDRVFSRFCIGK